MSGEPTTAIRVTTKDYGKQYAELWAELAPVLRQTFLQDKPILGKPVERFEASLARYHGVRHAIGLGSGTCGITLGLRELGLQEAEVLTCSHTFSGVVSGILQAGAKPVLVEPDRATGLFDFEAAEEAVTPRTRALLAVHLYGHPVDLDQAETFCRRHGLVLVEDAAQAHGAQWRGRSVGGFGAMTVLSFHPSKNLGAFGDGGAVLTSDDELDRRLRVVRNLGKADKYSFDRIAPNSKLDSLQAAILEVKLRHLDAWVERRRTLARRYQEGLSEVAEAMGEDFQLPFEDSRARHAYPLYVVRTGRRDSLREFLQDQGIRTGLHYPIAAHRQPGLEAALGPVHAPLAEELAETVVSLPLSHEHEDHEIDAVVDGIRQYFGVSR